MVQETHYPVSLQSVLRSIPGLPCTNFSILGGIPEWEDSEKEILQTKLEDLVEPTRKMSDTACHIEAKIVL